MGKSSDNKMFERYSDRARKVMALATREAQRFNHEYIGTEHILLGLIKEGEGNGVHIIKKYDIDLKKLRLNIEKNLEAGPDIVTIDKLTQTPKARQVVEYAIEYARKLKCPCIGTEHLLYGLIAETEGLAAQVLMNNNLDEGKIKKGIKDLLRESSQTVYVQDYWKIPRRDINLLKFLEITGYEVKEEPKSADHHLKILKVENSLKMQVGRLDLTREDPIEHKAPTVIYNLDDKKQIGYALDLRDLFNVNMVNYREEPPVSEVLRELRKPLGEDIVSLIDRLEKRGFRKN